MPNFSSSKVDPSSSSSFELFFVAAAGFATTGPPFPFAAAFSLAAFALELFLGVAEETLAEAPVLVDASVEVPFDAASAAALNAASRFSFARRSSTRYFFAIGCSN